MKPSMRRLPLLLCAALAAACGKDKSPTKIIEPECTVASVSGAPAPRAAVARLAPGPFHALFQAAGKEFGVPSELLESIGWTETRWHMVRGGQEFEGVPPAYGVMALRGEALERAARLAGVSAEAARSDALSNIRAAAALLAAYGVESNAEPAVPASWAGAVARLSGIDLPEARYDYAARVLGGAGVAPGPLPLAYAAADPCTPTKPPTGGTTDFAGALWRASPNFNARMAPPGGTIHMVIIHTCEGNYAGCWSWLVNSQSQVSAHYVVSEDGSEVTQTVREKDRAWQIAATYRCALNYNHDCILGQYEGVQSNHFTIGIEHGGFADNTVWPASFFAKSAALVCDITKRWDIPRDWRHIVAHGQLQPENRTDPGKSWPWTAYLGLIQRDCGELVVDDDNTRNDTSFVKVQFSANWQLPVPKFGTDTRFYAFDYHRAESGAATDDPMVFSFRLDQPATKTVEGWWIAAPDHSPQARYIAVSAAGDTLGSALVDQRAGGGDWQRLGQWTFPAGWNRVLLSRRGPAGSVVVGDAVRVK